MTLKKLLNAVVAAYSGDAVELVVVVALGVGAGAAAGEFDPLQLETVSTRRVTAEPLAKCLGRFMGVRRTATAVDRDAGRTGMRRFV